MRMVSLDEAELERLCKLVASELTASGSDLSPSTFIDNLVGKVLRRYGPLQALEDLEDRGIDIPNTGAWESDVRGFVRSFAAYLADPRTTAVLRYVTVARSADPQFGDWMDAFWAERGAAFDVIVQRAMARGDCESKRT